MFRIPPWLKALHGVFVPVINLARARRRVRSRGTAVLVACCGLLIALVLTISGITLSDLRDHALAANERQLEQTVSALAEQADRAFQEVGLVQSSLIERMEALAVGSSELYERGMSGRDMHLMLTDKISGLSQIVAMMVIGADGKLINTSQTWPVPTLSVADQSYFNRLKSDPRLQSVVSDPALDRETGERAVYLARKFVGANGKFLGLVVGAIKLSYFEQSYRTIVRGPDDSIALLRRDGVMLARYPHLETFVGKSFAATPLYSRVLSHADRGVIRQVSAVDGKERLVAGASFGRSSTVVAATTTVAAALADWRTEARYLIGLTLLLVGAIGGAGAVVVQYFRKQKTQLDTALNNMSQGLCTFDAAGRLVMCNQRYLDMYQLGAESEWKGRTLRDIIGRRIEAGADIPDPDAYCAEIIAALAEGKTHHVTVQQGRTIQIIKQPMAGGGWVATHEDITERRRLERERDRNQKFLNTIIENVPAPIFVKEAESLRYVLTNRAGEEFWGTSRGEMIGKTAQEVFAKEEADLIAVRDHQLLQAGRPLVDEREITTPRKGIRNIVSKRLIVHDDDGTSRYVVGVIEDVTERKQAEVRIAHMAHHDALTGLPNRGTFSERIAATLDMCARAQEKFALMCIDIDRFKQINDVFGHQTGDALLVEVARRLKAATPNEFVARMGGDEFTIIATGPQPITAESIADCLLGAVAGDVNVAGHELRIGVSVGIAIYPEDGRDVTTLLGNADAALYRAKVAGRGMMRFFAAEMDQQLRDRRSLQQDLHSAIEQDELALHFQPIARIDREIIGFEALARWHHPRRGIVPPQTFIPLAEESGLIIALGEWVLRQACQEAASWSKALQIAVNLSAIQFRHGDLPTTVHKILLETGLPASRLELEITEGVLIEDFSRAASILRRIKSLGVQISLDDFGTGYSSLSYLHSFPFDKLKIDQIFMADFATDRHSAAIVRAVIALAHGLGLKVLAEGIETDDQLRLLAAERVEEIQGYLLGRPSPIDRYAEAVGRLSHIGQIGARSGRSATA
jgi:diguanylate cyclase (GGDEF)-like protein/PAS domain S-box-containing protein